MIRIEVLGTPAPKGSSRAFVVPGTNRAVVAPSGSAANKKALKGWDAAVREAASAAVGPVAAPPFVETSLRVEITFRLARPSGQWGRRGLKPSAPKYPMTKPDLDKLARSTADSMKGIVYDDDSRIVEKVLRKLYADPGREGATIVVTAMETPAPLENLRR